MLAQWESYDWEGSLQCIAKLHPPKKRQLATARLRKVAVGLFEQEICRAILERQETIALPVFAAKVILDCAKAGQYRGLGRRRPPISDHDRIARQAIIDYARQRWAERGYQRGVKLAAAQVVLEENRGGTKLGKRLNLTPQSLMRLMGPKPKN